MTKREKLDAIAERVDLFPHECVIGVLHGFDDDNGAITVSELKEHIEFRVGLNKAYEAIGFKVMEWSLRDYADWRKQTNLTRFRYCTEKAEVVIEFRRRVDKGPLPWNEKLHWTPSHNFTLYKTQKGAYFEYDQDDETLGVVSEEDARRIVRKLDPDKYMEMFGEVEEA